MPSLDFAAIELMYRCPRCGAPMPVNAVTPRCTCSSCLAESELLPSVWQEAFDGIEKDVINFGAGYMRSGPSWGESGMPPGPHVEWLRGRDVPPCPACARPMALAWEEAMCRCCACGATRPILKPSAPLPPGTPILGHVSDEAVTAQPRPSQVVHVACTSCGAPLSADGSTRLVPCRFCAATVALPDSIWTALNPPRVKRRCWLIVFVLRDPRREPLSIGRDNRVFVSLLLALAIFWTPMIVGLFAPTPETGIGIVLVILFLLLGFWLRRIWRYARVCRPEHEIVGRLERPLPYSVWVGGRASVVLTMPCDPSQVLGRAALELDEGRFRELGGVGGRVRAWMVPGKPRLVHVEAIPSVLE